MTLQSPDDQISRHDAFLRRVAQAVVNDNHAADDLVQQTWIVAMARAPRDTDHLRAWLSRVVRNLALNRLRAEDRRRSHESSIEPANPPATLLDSMVRDEWVDRLERALDGLTDKQREVLRLRFYESRRIADIAERVDVPVETVRSRLRRGMRQLRAELDGEPPSGESRRRAWAVPPVLLRGSTSGLRLASRAMFMRAALVSCVGMAAVLLTSLALRGRTAPDVVDGAAMQRVEVASTERSIAVELAGSDPQRVAAVARDGAPRAGGAAIRLHWSEADEPASGVAFLLRHLDDLGGVALDTEFVTDPDGAVQIDDLPPGRYRIEVDRGARREFTVPSGIVRDVTVELGEGIDVSGVVKSSDGQLLAYADIWLSWPGDPLRGWHAARAGADGAFTLRGLDSGNWISARSKDHAAAPMRKAGDFEHATGSPVTLHAPPVNEWVRGLVLDERGDPIEGARVRKGTDAGLRPYRELDGTVRLDPPGLPTQSRDDGTFELPWTLRVPVCVDAPGYAPWMDVVDRDLLQEGRLVVRLDPGAELIGQVLDANGQGVAGALLEAWDPRAQKTYRAHTDRRGRYRIAHLPRGRLDLLAVKGPEAEYDTVDARGSETLRWSPSLRTCDSITGRAVDAGGAPLAGWKVQLQDSGLWNPGAWAAEIQASSHRYTTTDEGGGFAFFGCSSRGHILRLFPPASDRDACKPAAGVQGAKPSLDAVVLRVDGARYGSISATVRHPSGTLPSDVQVVLTSPHLLEDLPLSIDPTTGAVHASSLLPGRYVVGVRGSGGLRLTPVPVDLQAGEAANLGPLELACPGAIEVRITDVGGGPANDVRVTLRNAVGMNLSARCGELRPGFTYPASGTVRVDGLAPGDVQVLVERAGAPQVLRGVRVPSGEVARLDVPLVSGSHHIVRMMIPEWDRAGRAAPRSHQECQRNRHGPMDLRGARQLPHGLACLPGPRGRCDRSLALPVRPGDPPRSS